MKNKKDITHITMHEGHIKTNDKEIVISDHTDFMAEYAVELLKRFGICRITEDLELGHCAINRKGGWYSTVLFLEKTSRNMLLMTAGAVNEEDGMELWNMIRSFHKAAWGTDAPDAECPEVPYICDLLLPSLNLRTGIIEEIGEFTHSLGVRMMKELSQNME